MKNLYNVALVLLSGLLIFSSCKDEQLVNPDIKNSDIVNPGGDGEGSTGALAANFAMLNMMGEPFDSIDMGEPFMLVDKSTGRPDGFKWTVNGAVLRDSSNKMVLPLYCPLKGGYDVTLDVTRSSDNTSNSLTLEDQVKVRWIPVTADFVTDKLEDKNGLITIKHGDYVIFTDNSKGLPDTWKWTVPGATPKKSLDQSPKLQYLQPGVYDVRLKAKRSSDENEETITKAAYINVIERELHLIRATATDKLVTLQYNEPIQSDVSDLKDELYIKFEPLEGEVIVPTIESVKLLNEYEIEVTLDQLSYSDDKVYVSLDAEILYDATGLVTAPDMDAELCVYGHNLLENTDFEDIGKWKATKGKTYSFITDDPDPAQGDKCLKMVNEVDGMGFVYTEGIPFDENTTYQLSMELRSEPGIAGAFELTRFSTSANDGKVGPEVLSCGGGWMNATGISSTKWTTFTRTIEVYSGEPTELFYNFLHYGGAGTIYVDNLRLYIDNPRN